MKEFKRFFKWFISGWDSKLVTLITLGLSITSLACYDGNPSYLWGSLFFLVVFVVTIIGSWTYFKRSGL